MTRIGPGGEPHRLAAVEAVAGPDQFRYYERGHIHFSIPELGEQVPLVYRFEYELVNGVTPAWGVPAGPDSWEPGVEFIEPWRRLAGLVAEWREAIARGTTWRFDHDVLMPSREGPGYTVKQVDYHLTFDSAWRRTAPQAELAHVVPGDHYRASVAFEYLGTTPPAPVAREAALMRVGALAALPILGVAGWLLTLAAWRMRGRGGRIDRAFVDTRFLTRTPEELALAYDGTPPKAEAMLNRLIGQGAIHAQVGPPPPDDDLSPRVDLRLHVAPASLAPLEQDVVEELFGEARETSPEVMAQRYKGVGFDPQVRVDRMAESLKTMMTRGSWSLLSALAAVLGVGAFIFTFNRIGPGQSDAVPILVIAGFIGASLVAGWPKAWWSPGRPVRGLLVPLVLLTLLMLAMHLTVNRPFPPLAWAGASAAVLAGSLVTIWRSRAPDTGLGRLAGDAFRMRRFARAELSRPRPQLDDAWIPRLRALGLGKAIDAWRARHGGAFSPPPEFGGAAPITTARFTGMAPQPWAGPTGWLFYYEVSADDDEDEEDEENDEDDEDEDVAEAEDGDPDESGGDDEGKARS